MPGSKCVLERPREGICKGGPFPDTTSDRRATYKPTDPDEKIGDKCAFQADCGPLTSCVKPQGSLYGNCMK